MVEAALERGLVIPDGMKPFYRLIAPGENSDRDFWPNAWFAGKKQMWPGRGKDRGEDWVTFLGISCFDRLDRAAALAGAFNPGWEERNGSPRWDRVRRFYVDGQKGHSYAPRPPSPGHYTAWGHPAQFWYSADPPEPIPPA